jgi:chromosome segregation ATPase
VAALNRKVTALGDALSDSEEVQKRQAEKLEEAESKIQDLRGKVCRDALELSVVSHAHTCLADVAVAPTAPSAFQWIPIPLLIYMHWVLQVLSLENQEEDAGGQGVHMEAENMQLVARLREAETMVEEQREALNMASDMVEDLEAANAKLKKELEDEDGSESGYGSASASGDSALREAAERLKTEKKKMEDRIKELEGQEDHEILMAAQAEVRRYCMILTELVNTHSCWGRPMTVPLDGVFHRGSVAGETRH